MINLIGLTGLKQSGKTTAARYLRDTFAYHQADFASPIRSMVADMIGTTVEAMEQIKEQPHPVLGGRTPRYAMQSLGTEWGRQMIHPDVWVLAMTQQIRTSPRLVIADVRFDNEAELILRHGGHIIEIIRPGLTRDPHASEAGISRHYIRTTIVNDASRIHLYDRIDDALSALRRAAA